jgi:hypothetical protein
MTLKCILDIPVIEAPLNTIKMDIKRAKVVAMKWYIKSLLETHFKFGNAEKYNYPPLTKKYKAWKEKHFPGKPMLNLSGKLRQAVMSARVDPRTADIVIDSLPDYAEYVAEIRDFLTPNDEDLALIDVEFQKELLRIRRGRIATRFKI